MQQRRGHDEQSGGSAARDQDIVGIERGIVGNDQRAQRLVAAVLAVQQRQVRDSEAQVGDSTSIGMRT
jgi:hypothetical protein